MAARPDRIALTLPPHQREPLDLIATATQRTRTELIHEAIQQYLSRKMAPCSKCDRYAVIAGYQKSGPLCDDCM